jgi:hypothetical protein
VLGLIPSYQLYKSKVETAKVLLMNIIITRLVPRAPHQTKILGWLKAALDCAVATRWRAEKAQRNHTWLTPMGGHPSINKIGIPIIISSINALSVRLIALIAVSRVSFKSNRSSNCVLCLGLFFHQFLVKPTSKNPTCSTSSFDLPKKCEQEVRDNQKQQGRLCREERKKKCPDEAFLQCSCPSEMATL